MPSSCGSPHGPQAGSRQPWGSIWPDSSSKKRRPYGTPWVTGSVHISLLPSPFGTLPFRHPGVYGKQRLKLRQYWRQLFAPHRIHADSGRRQSKTILVVTPRHGIEPNPESANGAPSRISRRRGSALTSASSSSPISTTVWRNGSATVYNCARWLPNTRANCTKRNWTLPKTAGRTLA